MILPVTSNAKATLTLTESIIANQLYRECLVTTIAENADSLT
jgi:hypothetical protein